MRALSEGESEFFDFYKNSNFIFWEFLRLWEDSHMLQANMKRTEFGDMNGEDDDAEEERTDLKIQ